MIIQYQKSFSWFRFVLWLVSSLQVVAFPNNHWVIHEPRNISIFQNSQLIDWNSNRKVVEELAKYVSSYHPTEFTATDGETVDILEHFFWGIANGIVLEMGALEGTPRTNSMSYDLERLLQWKRILIEGNPAFRGDLKRSAGERSLAINAVICHEEKRVHYITSHISEVSGILEFMAPSFVRTFYPRIYQAATVNHTFDIQNLRQKIPHSTPVQCLPLRDVFRHFRIKYIDLFILDVEGAEMEVLQSINWNEIRFGVLVIETNPIRRPEGFANRVIQFMLQHGYQNVTEQIGRNVWFQHPSFVPSQRPNINRNCFRGYRLEYSLSTEICPR